MEAINTIADRLHDIGIRLAQELREYADAMQESGMHPESTNALLDEWETIHADTERAYQNT